MNFLYPGFLFALLSVAIPVIIHLFNFRKFKKVYFSNVQLLQTVTQQQSSREKLKNLLILLCRILAIVFLVLAFAQPYIPANHGQNHHLGNSVSVYIDNSYSMEAVNQDGKLLDEAKRRAKDLVKTFGVNDRFQLLTNDFEGKHQRLLSREDFLNALEEVKISPIHRNLQQILDRQSSILTDAGNHYSFILSDFQRNISNGKKLQSRKDIQYTLMKLRASSLPNIAVDSVWMLSPNHQPGANERLVVRLKNYTDEKASNVPLKLTINNQQKALSAINLSPGKSIQDTLSFSGLKPGWQKGMVTIKDFPVTFDDSLYFSFKVEEHLPVLSINGTGTGNYIKALFTADPYYQLTENEESNISYSSFSRFGLIILNGLKQPSSGLAQQLKAYLKAGGAVVIFPDLDANPAAYNAFLGNLTLPQITSVSNTETPVDHIDLQNPVFKTVFEEVPRHLDLPLVKRYLNFTDGATSIRENILSLPGKKLFFSRFGMGNGAVYLSASGLQAADGNLARHPVFVPLMYRLAIHAGNDNPLYQYVGNDQMIQTRKIIPDKNETLKITAKDFEAIPEIRQSDGKTLIYLADQVKNTGFYALNRTDSLIAVYAFNNNRSESDMHYLDQAAGESLSDQPNIKWFDTHQEAVKLISGNHQIGQTFWKLCLILSLIFIASEILLIRFFNHTKKII